MNIEEFINKNSLADGTCVAIPIKSQEEEELAWAYFKQVHKKPKPRGDEYIFKYQSRNYKGTVVAYLYTQSGTYGTARKNSLSAVRIGDFTLADITSKYRKFYGGLNALRTDC